ncbi:MAG: sodium:solute symporter [Phycisphaerales bacterium]|nr:MAG: sodium:solute symporter [Phycisphaerales bacterium]
MRVIRFFAQAESVSSAGSEPTFVWIDWMVLAGYVLLVVLIGLWASRRRGRDGDDYFLAGRSMPMWAVAISVLATAQSAATFVGGPQQSYAGDLTYFASNLAPIIAAIIVAIWFLPAFYRHGVTSVYELIGHEMGTGAQKTASAMFMIGRVFASGARLFIVAIPFSLVAFGDIEPNQLVLSILIIAIVATFYSLAGGIRAVIWTDLLQVIVYVVCILIALVLIWRLIPVGAGEIITALRTEEAGSKLLIVDLGLDFSQPYSLWAILTGLMLFNLAALGMDQDLTQRMLTCKSARQASGSVLLSVLITLPVVFIFLVMGLLLYVFYERPDLMGEAAPLLEVERTGRVFVDFILTEMHPGVRGLMMAGLFAAAMSTMDSGLNAMSSTSIADFIRPWRTRRNVNASSGDLTERRIGRALTVFWALAISGFAVVCIFWYEREFERTGETLIDFALGVMTFAYSGLLGVFFTAVFTNRGNARSAVAAMMVGFVAILAMNETSRAIFPWPIEDVLETLNAWLTWPFRIGLEEGQSPAFAWRLLIATVLSTAVCMIPKRGSHR